MNPGMFKSNVEFRNDYIRCLGVDGVDGGSVELFVSIVNSSNAGDELTLTPLSVLLTLISRS